MKKLNGIHTCTNSFISQDHVRLDSYVNAHNIVHLVKTYPGIEIKTLITDMHQRFGYTFGIGYEMRKLRFEAKLLAIRAEFPQAADWLVKFLRVNEGK